MDLLTRVSSYGRMIRFSHSVFALPFALTSAALAVRGELRTSQVVWIVVAMVGARSAAMGFNRLADHALDEQNPRTASRELPRGALSRREVWIFVVLSAGVLVLAAGMLNPLCLALSPVALLVVFGYSYTKRFTALSHLFLGLALGVAPVGAWLAIRGRFEPVPILLALAVVAWVGGFDIIYACLDMEFDRRAGLYSLPARLGVPVALGLARVLHVVAVVLLAWLYWLTPLHPLYLGGVMVVAVLLAYEHSLVRAEDLSRVMQAFNLNGWVSLGYFAATVAARWLA
ncbi:MAG TPA: UbiA-like polyprenyltransferase [Vicinamibacteria bacterium]|jgi:4-hydroxybenzoate polyprenyltransferase|nr:UbiA-like polyprenyltransferase [Vicinamibacteria bacterium]